MNIPMAATPRAKLILTETVAGSPSHAYERMRALANPASPLPDPTSWVRAARALRAREKVSTEVSWFLDDVAGRGRNDVDIVVRVCSSGPGLRGKMVFER